jgi:phosphoglycolate phosphatase-like HAD superfamily hydrolase
MTQTYKAPNIPSDKITPVFVRDELLQCFQSANKEFMTLLNQPVTDEQLKQQVRQFVESVFINCGASYTNPTKQGILTAIDLCRSNAEKMMGPQGTAIIQHHYDEMMKLVDRLQDPPTHVATFRFV